MLLLSLAQVPPTPNTHFFQGMMSTSTKKGGIYHGKWVFGVGGRLWGGLGQV